MNDPATQKRNVSLIIGLMIPVVMVLLIASAIYLPGMFAPAPRFNFLYVTDDQYYYGAQGYAVEQGTLVKREVKRPEHAPPGNPRLFVHLVGANESREVSFEEAQRLRLNPSAQSPDGYEVSYGSRDYGVFPLFFSGDMDHDAMYLTGHSASKRLKLNRTGGSRYGYYGQARFIAWLQEEGRP